MKILSLLSKRHLICHLLDSPYLYIREFPWEILKFVMIMFCFSPLLGGFHKGSRILSSPGLHCLLPEKGSAGLYFEDM